MADMNDDQRKLLNSRKQNTYDSVSTNNALGECEDDTPVSLLQGLNLCMAITAMHSRICNKGCFTRKKCITGWIPRIIDLLSLLTCQYIRPVNDRAKKNCPARCSCCCSTPFMIILIAVFAIFVITISIIPTSAFLAGWIECPYSIYNICSTVKQHDGTPILILKDTNHTEPPLINLNNIKEVQKFLDLSKIAILFSTTASGVSQVFFFWALWCLFIKHWPHTCNCTNSNHWKKFKSFFCCVRDNDYESTKPLDPFDDDVENEVFEPFSIVVVYQHKKKKISTSGQMGSYFMEQDTRTNTPLQGERLCHYIVWFAIALILLIITVSLFFGAQYAEARKDVFNETSFQVESVAVTFHAYSLFRSLVSCFIFSKLMYGIQRKCEELEMFVFYVDDHYNEPLDENNELYKYVQIQFDDVLKKLKAEKSKTVSEQDIQVERSTQEDNDDKEIVDSYNYIIDKITNESEKIVRDQKALALKYLDERDKHFVKKAVATLSWLQLWFLLHWLLHIISTVMIMTVLVDAVTLHVKAKVPPHQQGVEIHPVEIGFLFMYSLMQCFFLFYPCLRAASVTRTRQRVIRKISENIHSFENIPPDVVNKFIDSMKRRRFNFRLRIFCAQMPFNMNIAYLSIAFGFVGVVLSLITSVTD